MAVIAGLTVWRLGTLAFDGTDLFMDEAQYWFWGQNLDWGYYSKPPMIAFVSRVVTDLAGSDAVFWVRAPGPVLHAATAVLTGLAAARLFDARVGAWAAILYITTPFATFGSWQFSTDTVLLPFFAGSVLAYLHLTERASVGWALALGVLSGLGFLSKYAMLYLPLMVALAAALLPRARIAWRDAGLAVAAFLVVAAPNLIWNVRNGGTTVKHVAVENARIGQTEPDLTRGLEFVASQFGVFGPVLFALLLVGLWRVLRRRAGPEIPFLLLLSLPVVALMTFQAVRALAYANWAVTAYVAGTILAAALLAREFPRLRAASLALHLAIAAAIPLLYVFPEAIRLSNGELLAARYLGQVEFSQSVAKVARDNGLGVIVGSNRAVLADLNHTLRDGDLTIHARPRRDGRIRSYYDQSHALPRETTGPVLLVRRPGGTSCSAETLAELAPKEGFHAGRTYELVRIDATCLVTP